MCSNDLVSLLHCRCHRLRSTTQCEGLRQFTEPVGVPSREAERVELVACVGSSRDTDKLGTTFWRALHSWVHPQASLPLAVLSSLATARGGNEGTGAYFISCGTYELSLSLDADVIFYVICFVENLSVPLSPSLLLQLFSPVVNMKTCFLPVIRFLEVSSALVFPVGSCSSS